MQEPKPFHGFLTVQSRGLVTLPVAIRKRYRLDEPGAQLEMTERADGVLELRPMQAVPANETWFWDSQWQVGEQEVDVHLTAGEVIVTDGPDEFIASLPSSAAE
jgi:antitoxin MazE